MTVTLSNKTYTIARTMSGAPLVILQRSPRVWRVADAQTTARVLARAGMALRVVS